MPGDGRSSVYAEVAELEQWLKSAADIDGPDAVEAPAATPAEPPVYTPPPRPTRFIRLALLAAGAVAAASVIALGFGPVWAGMQPVPAEAKSLYFTGTQAWQTRTPASLNAALDDFNRAIALAPAYADAYAGLANAYNLMPEYTSMPASMAYPKAEIAAQKAIRLNPGLGTAHAALAFARFYGQGDVDVAVREYQTALALNPSDANAEHWLATTLFTVGDFHNALTHINRARALDPDCLSIQADRGVILSASDPEGARVLLRQIEAGHPDFLSPHTYLYYVYNHLKDYDSAVSELEQAARLRGNVEEIALADAARDGLKAGGERGMLQNMLSVKRDQFLHGRAEAYEVAQLYARLGSRENALTFLNTAFQRHEAATFSIRVDEAFDSLKGMPEFEKLARLAPAVKRDSI